MNSAPQNTNTHSNVYKYPYAHFFTFIFHYFQILFQTPKMSCQEWSQVPLNKDRIPQTLALIMLLVELSIAPPVIPCLLSSEDGDASCAKSGKTFDALSCSCQDRVQTELKGDRKVIRSMVPPKGELNSNAEGRNSHVEKRAEEVASQQRVPGLTKSRSITKESFIEATLMAGANANTSHSNSPKIENSIHPQESTKPGMCFLRKTI